MSDSVILDAGGKPMKKAESKDCPNCGAGKDKRRVSGFSGEPCCESCGHVFKGEVFRG